MKQSEALEFLEHFITALQRVRSITLEKISLEECVFAWPWVFGDRCPLAALEKATARKRVTGMEFYNFMFILNKFMPEVAAYGLISMDIDFPEPKLEWIKTMPSDLLEEKPHATA